MIEKYLQAAATRARYEQLENGDWCASVRGLRGVIALGRTVEACRTQLLEVVEEWVLIRIARGLAIPRLGTASIRIRDVNGASA